MKIIASDRILVLTSYSPRVCGIATYAQDLVTALNRTFSAPFRYVVCALEDTPILRNYPGEVTRVLNTSDPEDHACLAFEVDHDPRIKIVWVQHEFGLYNGGRGDHLLRFMQAIHKPVTITFHTVLPAPGPERLEMMRALAGASTDIIVLTERSARILREEYGVSNEKISVIPHGTHTVTWRDKQRMKKKYGLEDRQVLSTFGLLSSNKSIETALDALVMIKERIPNVLYLVLGRTHPEVVRQEGEQYRDTLLRKVEALGLRDHVKFVDRYLELDELLEHLQLTDVYLFTSKDPEQAVSGTFAYAMACGCPVISTRIPHAVEVLDEGTGVLIDFNSPEQLAHAASDLLADAERMDRMGRNALHRMRVTAWDNVAIAHARTFARRMNRTEQLRFQWPPITLKHIRRLTRPIGMVQFCDISEPDLASGHTLDDNARALIAVCMHAHNEPASLRDTTCATRYLDHILHCQQKDGRFLNYMDHHGDFTPQNGAENLEDSNGRAVWALGVCVAHEHVLPTDAVSHAEHALWACLPWLGDLTSPRAIGFAIKGLHAYNSVKKDQRITDLIDRSAQRLLNGYRSSAVGRWKWFEPILTYGNAVLPEALLLAYLETGRVAFRETARVTFEFLLGCMFKNDMLRIISNRTWLEPDREPHPFGEQPIDAAYTISALALFHEVFGEEEHHRKMNIAFEWFLGRNHLSQVMYNRASGGCYDGLEEHNVNLNQGAESTVCYLLARSIMERASRRSVTLPASRPVLKVRTAVMLRPSPSSAWSAKAGEAQRDRMSNQRRVFRYQTPRERHPFRCGADGVTPARSVALSQPCHPSGRDRGRFLRSRCRPPHRGHPIAWCSDLGSSPRRAR
ncbi:MAG: glycosyltransferase [Flavobacteriales bacterium]|nr:glycosyltransferase [Flavobacteriales bacterium]